MPAIGSLRDVPTNGSLGLLTLLKLPRVGPAIAERCRRLFGTIGEALDAPAAILGSLPEPARLALRDANAWSAALVHAQRTLDAAARAHVRVVAIGDTEYPARLRGIPDPPLVLYVRGNLGPAGRAVACIGTREPSAFGQRATPKIAGFLAGQGWSVVSGLALGVDSLAHQAALAAGGHTVAVLANGLDTVYPRANARLAAELLDAGGALVGEQPPGERAISRNLVARDRLQSGLAVGTIVMQTDIVGGSMHTVRFTLLQRRLLFAPVPQGEHAHDPKSKGLLALTSRSGLELSGLLRAEGAYARLLESEFRERPPAIGIRSREDYQEVLTCLETAHGVTSAPPTGTPPTPA